MVEWASMMMISAVITATWVEELILYNRIVTWKVVETTKNGEMEMAVCEWLRMQESDCYCDGISKVVPRC